MLSFSIYLPLKISVELVMIEGKLPAGKHIESLARPRAPAQFAGAGTEDASEIDHVEAATDEVSVMDYNSSSFPGSGFVIPVNGAGPMSADDADQATEGAALVAGNVIIGTGGNGTSGKCRRRER